MNDIEPEQWPEPERDPQAHRAAKDAAQDLFADLQGDDDRYPTATRYLSSTEVARYLGLAVVNHCRG